MEADRTILFADICNSTGITEALGDAESRQHFAKILDDLGVIAARRGGWVVKTIGDEVMCCFDAPAEALDAAIDMQRALIEAPWVGGSPSAVKIGVHSGRVILEGDDVFGDVVNVAARVISLAVSNQILTTGDTLAQVPPEDLMFRSLGKHQVRGRDTELHLCEVLWRGETAALTAVAPKLESLPAPEMHIRVGDLHVSMSSASSEAVSLGRGAECTVVVASSSASRAHAKIMRRGSLFYLEDHSTNGTFLQPKDGQEIFVHRDQVVLQGSGRIRLGEPVSVPSPLDIEFKTVYLNPDSSD